MKQCAVCHQEWHFDQKEAEFHQKMDVPTPTLCHPCRQQRRLAYRNERVLYRRTCDLTGEKIISIYPQDAPFPVYSPDAWYSDKWDDLEHGQEFDFNRPFFEQFYELQKKVPKLGLHVMNLENSPFVSQCWYLKNSYLCFDVGFCEDALYCYGTYHSKNVVDTSFTYNSEISYELVDCQKCYQCMYCQDCNNCNEAYFSFDCNSCNNIAFCSNLRNQNFMIFNKKVTPEEFAQFKKEMARGSHALFQKYLEKYAGVRAKALHRENNNFNSQDCTGDHIRNSKNCTDSFDVSDSQEIHLCTRMDEKAEDCMDIDHGAQLEMAYDSTSVAGYNLRFGIMSLYSNNCTYFHTLKSCSNCFGCISLKNREYCILNKQYSKEEYEALVPRIIEHMGGPAARPRAERAGLREGAANLAATERKPELIEWGEFFPIKYSPLAYNESVASEYYPLTEERALALGYRWKEKDAKEYMPQTFVMPDAVSDVPPAVVNEILACATCGKNYKIIIQELEFYRKWGIPLPRDCADCRHLRRKNMRSRRKLHENSCTNCGKRVSTGYSPEENLRILCDECYLKAIY